MSRTRSISHSEVDTALTCQARHAFSYTGRLTGDRTLRRRTVAPILRAGRAWGAAVAQWHANSGNLLAGLFAYEALQQSLEQDAAEMAENGAPVDPNHLAEQELELAACLDHYMATAVQLPNLTKLEEEGNVPLPSRSGRGSSSVYRFQFFLDGFCVDGYGNEWLVEFKRRGQLTSREVAQKQRQIRWYAWGRQQTTDRPVVGVLLDEWLADFPHPARIVQAGKESPLLYECLACGAITGEPCTGKSGPMKTVHPERRELVRALYGPSHAVDQVTTPELYVAACERYGVEPKSETVEALRARVWGVRHPIIFRPGELEEAGKELISAGKLIRDLDNGDKYPIRNAKAINCRTCFVRDVCERPGDDLYIETLFRWGTPKRLHNQTPAEAPQLLTPRP